MSFWLNESTKATNSRQLQFYMDTDSDLSLLPTISESGLSDNVIYNLPCGKGSTAISLATGNIYVLNSSGQWILVPISSGSGGGLPVDLSGYVSYSEQEKTDEEKEVARINIGTVSATSIEEIGRTLLTCFKNVAWINEDGQAYYDALKLAFGITDVEDEWTYEWYSTSGEVPTGMSYSTYSFSSESGALLVNSPNLNFNHVGNCELEIECKWYYANSESSTQQNPQIVVVTASGSSGNSGAKFFGNSTSGRNVNSNISGSMTATDVSGDEYHIYNIKAENGNLTLSVDGTIVSQGSGVSNNQYLSYTGIAGNSIGGCGLYIKSIKFKEV